jgi:hypothetical protein
MSQHAGGAPGKSVANSFAPWSSANIGMVPFGVMGEDNYLTEFVAILACKL